jgi:hypothetical protein
MGINDIRAAERFRTAEQLPGSFGSASVALIDVSACGAQIEHAQPLRLGTRGRFWFRRGQVGASVQALTVWSHLSRTPNAQGKYLYHSGLKLEALNSDYERALQELLEHGVITPDRDSLERKRKRDIERIAEARTRPVMKFLNPEIDVPTDQQLLIEHARKRLLSNPEEAQRWRQRAKYAITQGTVNIATDSIRDRQDVLAVWEYLERSIEISTIITVFEKLRTSH